MDNILGMSLLYILAFILCNIIVYKFEKSLTFQILFGKVNTLFVFSMFLLNHFSWRINQLKPDMKNRKIQLEEQNLEHPLPYLLIMACNLKNWKFENLKFFFFWMSINEVRFKTKSKALVISALFYL